MISNFKDRLNEAIRIRNIKQAELAKKSGLSKAQISQYCNGIYEAKQIALHKLAVALNVDEAWLMGHDVNMERTIQLIDITDSEKKIIIEYRKADPITKNNIKKLLEIKDN